MVDDEQLVLETVTMLRLLCAHAATNAKAYGDGIAEAGLVPVLRQFSAWQGAVRLSHSRGVGIARPYSSDPPLTQFARHPHTIDLAAVANSPTELLLTAKMLLEDVFQEFGEPELLQIDPDG